MKLFIVECHYGEITAEMTAARPAHRAYIEAQLSRGLIAAAGRATTKDSVAGLYIIPAEDEESAKAVLTEDRFVTEGYVREITARRWALAFGEVGIYSADKLDPE